jgi:ParB/RepB/Spo0J family partition protein
MSKKLPAVIKVVIDELIEDPDNPNKMTEVEFGHLVKHIEEQGFVAPILVRREGKKLFIADGHHRARAAKKAGYTEVLAVEWDGTEEQRKLLAIGMNKIRGELDLSEVAKIFADLHADGVGMDVLTLTGYTEDEISDLLSASAAIVDDSDDPMADTKPMREEDESPIPERPLVLELTFATSEEMKKAKRGLRRAAGKGRELGEGLLILLGQKE